MTNQATNRETTYYTEVINKLKWRHKPNGSLTATFSFVQAKFAQSPHVFYSSLRLYIFATYILCKTGKLLGAFNLMCSIRLTLLFVSDKKIGVVTFRTGLYKMVTSPPRVESRGGVCWALVRSVPPAGHTDPHKYPKLHFTYSFFPFFPKTYFKSPKMTKSVSTIWLKNE